CLAGGISCRAGTASGDRSVRRAPPRRSHAGPPKSPIVVVLSPSKPIHVVVVASRRRSIGRAGFYRRALELVRSGNQAVETSHCAAVILLGDAHEQIGDTIGGGGQEALIVQL